MAIKLENIKKPTEQKAVAAYFSESTKQEKPVEKSVEKQHKKVSPTASVKPVDKEPEHDAKSPVTEPEGMKENRSKRVSVLTTPEIFRNVNALASLYGLSVNEIINSQLEKYLSENDSDLKFALELMERSEKYKGGKK